MGTGFSNPLVGGGGALVYPSIHSPNFDEATQTGWSVDKNGDAFFYGIVTSGAFMGTNFEINSAGAFFYSATPAAGDLIASIAGTAGDDQYGNPYMAGFAIYGTGGVVVVLAVPGGGFPGGLEMISGAAFEKNGAFLAPVVSGSGGTEAIFSQWFGPAATDDMLARITLRSGSEDGSSLSAEGFLEIVDDATDTATVIATWNASGVTAAEPFTAEDGIILDDIAAPSATAAAATLYGASGQPAYVNPAGLQANLSGSQLADFTATTVTSAGLTDIGKAWSIPAGDAVAGAVYKLNIICTATQGSTAQGGEFGLVFAGSNQIAVHFPSGVQAVGDAFGMWFEATIVCVTAGSGATWWIAGRVSAGTGDAGTAQITAATVTQSSLPAISVQAAFAWTATTGAPTMTTRAGWFQRIA